MHTHAHARTHTYTYTHTRTMVTEHALFFCFILFYYSSMYEFQKLMDATAHILEIWLIFNTLRPFIQMPSAIFTTNQNHPHTFWGAIKCSVHSNHMYLLLTPLLS